MRSFFAFMILFCALTLPIYAQTPQTQEPEKTEKPFVVPVSAENWTVKAENGTLTVSLTLPKDVYAYEKATGTNFVNGPEEKEKRPDISPKPVRHGRNAVFKGTVEWVYKTDPPKFPCILEVRWQACSEAGECYLPGSAALAVFDNAEDWKTGKFHAPVLPDPATAANIDDPEPPSALKGGWIALPEYRILRTASGYMSPGEFTGFLNGRKDEGFFRLAGRGLWMTLIVVLLGGLALNLTPCVLPLIPVNLAMIGAGKDSENTRAGRIFRGTVYGTGIAAAYGLLGVVAVMTGSTMGSLASNWLFNAVATLVFLLLALAMFGAINFDLSRYGATIKLPDNLHYAGIFLMGALSATLAGACVAPVLAAVLIEAAGMYANGNPAGLLLPFLLGIGMALPWPFAAAGLALFPKPGAWMVRIKQALGILIFVLAAYYGFLAFELLSGEIRTKDSPVPQNGLEEIASALQRGEKEKKPVLLDFGATWCKNCTAMEVRTLPDPEVRTALQNVILIKISAEDPNEPETKALLEQFNVIGLPSFVLLQPVSGEAKAQEKAQEKTPKK